MTTSNLNEPLPPHLSEPSKIGTEISITGKWVPAKKGGLFRKSVDTKEMLQEWEDIHAGARRDPGVLSTEIDHAIGEEALLVHHVFRDVEALGHYFSTTASEHMAALYSVARPELHLVRGVDVPAGVKAALAKTEVPVAFGDWLFGYVKEDYRRPDPESAIQVTAKWTCKPGASSHLEELKHWWQQVGTDAYDLEKELLRFEAYQVAGEDALIIHETFRDSAELKFHLTKGTAARYKTDIDKIAAPECYYFRGPVAWTIRTYSRFMHLPATYTSHGSAFTRTGGSMSEGTTS
jgi:quinol monooxygenase YgiN